VRIIRSCRSGHAKRTPIPGNGGHDGLAKYETEDAADNYRHRMMVNMAALLATVALSIAGAWLVLQLADVRKNQDCVLSGRSNCMRIETTAPQRP
jgi:hypothetical protein